MPSVNAASIGGYYGVGPLGGGVTVPLSVPPGSGITKIELRSRIGTNGYGPGVYSYIYKSNGGELLCGPGGPQNAGPNAFGGANDPGLSGVLDTYTPPEPRTDIASLYLYFWTNDGSGIHGFGEVVQADYTYEEVPGVSVVSVETDDAAPLSAPHRLSKVSGRDIAELKFKATGPPGTVRGYTVRAGGVDAVSGDDLSTRGLCGTVRASTSLRVGVVEAAVGEEITAEIRAKDIAGADGERAAKVYAWIDGEGWV